MQSSIWFLNYEISMLATNVVSSWVLTYKDLVFCWNQTHVYEIYSSVAFKDLGKLMLEVGLMLARHCDYYANRKMVNLFHPGADGILTMHL